MMSDDKTFENLLGPDLVEILGPKLDNLTEETKSRPVCSFCQSAEGIYVLDKVFLNLRTSEGGLHVVQSTPTNQVVACAKDKNSANDEYVAEGCHLGVMQETNVQSEMDSYDVYWQLI